MKEKFIDRNKNIFNLFVNEKMSYEDIEAIYNIKKSSIKIIIRNYIKNTSDSNEIINYNQRMVLIKTNLSEQDLKYIYESFVKCNWDIPINNDKVKKYNIDFITLYMYAKLYQKFFVNLTDEIYGKDSLQISSVEKFSIAKNMVMYYIDVKKNSIDINRETFCTDNNILPSQLSECIHLIKEKELSLYNQYLGAEQYGIKQNTENEKHQIYLLIDQLNNGKEDDGIIREYDSIDFEFDFNNNINHLSKITAELFKQKQISRSNLYLIKSFINKIGFIKISSYYYQPKYFNFNEKEIQDALNSYKEINCECDKNGYPIKGTGTIIAYEENKQVIDFINDNNLTLNCINFQSGINRIALGIKLNNKQKKLK